MKLLGGVQSVHIFVMQLVAIWKAGESSQCTDFQRASMVQ